MQMSEAHRIVSQEPYKLLIQIQESESRTAQERINTLMIVKMGGNGNGASIDGGSKKAPPWLLIQAEGLPANSLGSIESSQASTTPTAADDIGGVSENSRRAAVELASVVETLLTSLPPCKGGVSSAANN